MDKQINEAPAKSWGKLADEAMHNPYVDLAVGVAVGAALVMSRGKIVGAAESLFPRASALLGESVKTGEATTNLAPETIMSSRIFSRPTEELVNLASSPRVSPNVLDSLTEHFSPTVLDKVAQNPLTTTASLEKLADSPAFTPFIAMRIAGNPNASGALLARMAEHAPDEVSRHVNASPETLTKILNDQSVSGNSILGAALNPNTPIKSLDSLTMRDSFGMFATDTRGAVAHRLVHSADTSPQALDALADAKRLPEPFPSRLRRQIAEHANTSSKTLDQLSTDPKGEVRRAVRLNPNTSPDTLTTMDQNLPPLSDSLKQSAAAKQAAEGSFSIGAFGAATAARTAAALSRAARATEQAGLSRTGSGLPDLARAAAPGTGADRITPINRPLFPAPFDGLPGGKTLVPPGRTDG